MDVALAQADWPRRATASCWAARRASWRWIVLVAVTSRPMTRADAIPPSSPLTGTTRISKVRPALVNSKSLGMPSKASA